MRPVAKEIAAIFSKFDFSYIDEGETLLQPKGSLELVEDTVAVDMVEQEAPKHPDHHHELTFEVGP